MARILYGVCGEGSGHSSRAKEVVNHLIEKGHEVKILSYDRGLKNLSQNFEMEEIAGLGFHYAKNEIQLIPTLIDNAIKIPQFQQSIQKVIKIADKFKPQIVFSDFEPISCIVANMKNLPLVSIDNQHRLINTAIEYPKKYALEAEAAKAVTRAMIFNSKACLVISFDQPKIINQKTFLFPPILRKEVLQAEPTDGDYILVYLTSPSRPLIDILKNIRKKFIVYGFNEDRQDQNLIFKKASQEGFLKDLAGAQGIVANAGFTLISEALYLGKPYLAWPAKNQFEQTFNAYYIDKLGYGKFLEQPNKEKIEAFLFSLDSYKENLKKYQKENNSKIFAKIDELIKQYT
ncbi:MAG: MJ1255/VC2487 family glycosyltransferase [bacterium]